MAYKKKYVSKKRRSFKSRKPTVKKLAKKVNRLYRAIEHKYHEISGIGALPTNDPTLAIRPYGTIFQGDSDVSERIGDVITVKQVRFQMSWELLTGFSGRKFRVVAMVYKNNPDAITTATSTIWNLCMESAQANSVNAVNCFRDHDNMKSFAVIKDFSFTINPTDTLAGTTKNVNFVVNIPQRYQQIQYVANGTTISRNELLVYLVAETDGVSSINYVCRFNYTDM